MGKGLRARRGCLAGSAGDGGAGASGSSWRGGPIGRAPILGFFGAGGLGSAACAVAAAAVPPCCSRSTLKAAASAYGLPLSGSMYLAGLPVTAHTAAARFRRRRRSAPAAATAPWAAHEVDVREDDAGEGAALGMEPRRQRREGLLPPQRFALLLGHRPPLLLEQEAHVGGLGHHRLGQKLGLVVPERGGG